MKNGTKANRFIILLVVLLALNVIVSLIVSRIAKLYGIANYYESYEGDTALAEDIELSDEFTIQVQGKPVYIPKGTIGVVSYNVNYYSGNCLSVSFILDDGSKFGATVPIDGKVNYEGLQIDLKKLESAEVLVSEYRKAEQRLNSRIRTTEVLAGGLTFIIFLIVIVIILSRIKASKTDQDKCTT